MSHDEPVESPVEWTRKLIVKGWRNLKSVYYTNSWSWRMLKSGALFFMGFFLWSSANLLLSYRPDWTWLYYPMAYGFALIPYGPFTHLVVVPLVIRLRRQGNPLNRHLTKANLTVFILIVLVLGTFPPGVMTFDFRATLESGGVDIDPALTCTKGTGANDTVIHCHLSGSEGIDSVVVESGGEEILVDSDPPFEFNVPEGELNEVVGQKQFQVVLRDGDGETIRRYTRSASLIR